MLTISHQHEVVLCDRRDARFHRADRDVALRGAHGNAAPMSVLPAAEAQSRLTPLRRPIGQNPLPKRLRVDAPPFDQGWGFQESGATA